jgi:hypothetical protein
MSHDSGAARRALADPSLHATLGGILRATRVESGKTQRQVAAEAGVSAGLVLEHLVTAAAP